MARWNGAKASTWMKRTARELGSDFIDMPYEQSGDMGELLRASAGALYYAIDMGIGYNTQAEFETYLAEQVGWAESEVQEAVDDILYGP